MVIDAENGEFYFVPFIKDKMQSEPQYMLRTYDIGKVVRRWLRLIGGKRKVVDSSG